MIFRARSRTYFVGVRCSIARILTLAARVCLPLAAATLRNREPPSPGWLGYRCSFSFTFVISLPPTTDKNNYHPALATVFRWAGSV